MHFVKPCRTGFLGKVGAVLFDLDGTLVDSAPDLGAAANKMRTDRGLSSLPQARYRPMVGTGARGMISVAFDVSPENSNFESLRQEFFANYESRLVVDTCVFDGVVEVINRLGSLSIPWGVVTNKSARFTVPLTKAMPQFSSAGAIVSGDTTPFAKPHPAPLLEAARRLGVDAKDCVYVGDDERDIVAGRAAGMVTVAAAYGYLGADAILADWNADFTIEKPIGLLQLLGLV